MKVHGKKKEVQKSLMHVQSCYFANLNTLLFFAVLVAVAVHIKHQSSKIICGQQTIRSNGS